MTSIIHLAQEAIIHFCIHRIQMAIQFSHVEITAYRILIPRLLHIVGSATRVYISIGGSSTGVFTDAERYSLVNIKLRHLSDDV
jgi:hypothetical protein